MIRSAGWAHLGDDSYLPEGCYAKSGILDEMYYLVRKFNGAPQGENILCLGYASLVVKSALSLIDKKYLLVNTDHAQLQSGLIKEVSFI